MGDSSGRWEAFTPYGGKRVIMKAEKKIEIREDLILVRLKIREGNIFYYKYFQDKNSPESDIERDRRCHS